MSFLDEVAATNKEIYTQVCSKILFIVTGAQEHELNDGQIDQKVKEADLPTLQRMKAMYENEIAEAEGCIDGANHTF